MPLEALIDPDTGGVIVVKPRDSVWGRCEVNAVVLLDDPALEQELTESGGEHVVYPYAAWEDIDLGKGAGVRGQGSGEKEAVAVARRLTDRQLREASLVGGEKRGQVRMSRKSL